jgi:selenocysteine lyase/cysteine desulfurase
MDDEKWVEKTREDFHPRQRWRNGKPPIYYDNAYKTPVAEQVIQTINEYYRGVIELLRRGLSYYRQSALTKPTEA